MKSPELDRRFMAAALSIGRRNAGHTWPNPSVGAIVTRDDGAGPTVIGRGVTAPGGRPHAEPLALAEAGDGARGATAYVTLEPCSHQGRTGPCAVALRDAGVARVVTAIEDPNPLVAGQGHAILREAGIEVVTGILAEEAARDHAGHIRRVRDGRPHVRLKMAMSSDGFVGREGAGQIAISSPEALDYVHGLRTSTDAILVGIGTALSDDPSLTCRLPGLVDRSPVRVVLDSAGRLPVDSKLVRTAGDAPLWIVTTHRTDPALVAAWQEKGVTVLPVDADGSGRVSLPAALAAVSAQGITSVLVEGGPRVANALLDADLIDEMIFDVSPMAIGAGGIPAFSGKPPEAVPEDPRFVQIGDRRLGVDRVLRFWRKERS